jgi:iron complex transport system ATP-binding protein
MNNTTILTLENVFFKYHKNQDYILKNISLSVKPNDFTAVLGPNGAGKSTLLKLASKIINKTSGKITLNNNELSAFHNRDFAKHLAYLPQEVIEWYDISVKDIVFQGRYPYLKGLGFVTKGDEAICYNNMNLCSVMDFKDRMMSELSGGEKQRVRLASILSQQPDLLILDEPTSFLDIHNELDFFKLLSKLSLSGKGILISTHNINLASLFCRKLVLIDKGEIICNGNPEEVITQDNISKIYGRGFIVTKYSETNKPFIMPSVKNSEIKWGI